MERKKWESVESGASRELAARQGGAQAKAAKAAALDEVQRRQRLLNVQRAREAHEEVLRDYEARCAEAQFDATAAEEALAASREVRRRAVVVAVETAGLVEVAECGLGRGVLHHWWRLRPLRALLAPRRAGDADAAWPRDDIHARGARARGASGGDGDRIRQDGRCPRQVDARADGEFQMMRRE